MEYVKPHKRGKIMTTPAINGAIEFVSTKGERGGIDAQINDWVKANPEATIVDVKYRVAVYQDDGKNKLAKLALVLYNGPASTTEVSVEQPAAEPLTIPKSMAKSDDKPGARTMVMNLRKDLNFDELNLDE